MASVMESQPVLGAVQAETVTRCRSCGSQHLELLIDYGQMPLAGGFMQPDEVVTRNLTYPLRLARCGACTLIQLLDSMRPEHLFRHYSYASSTTRSLVAHFAQMGDEIVKSFNAQGKLVVEFGCNDGVLLRPLLNAGATVVGVDPSDVALRASRAQSWPLINEFFDEVVAAEILSAYGKARIVVGNNVFAHLSDINAVTRAVTMLLDDDGAFIFEVHYQGDLIEGVQFDTVYHEHICYYSVTSLVQLLSRHGLRIAEVTRIPIHSGSIRVIAVREDSSRPTTQNVAALLESEKALEIDQFIRKVHARRDGIHQLINDLRRAGHMIVAYGAAGRATVMLNYCELGPECIEYVVDMSPLRHGKLVPGVLIPIVPPDRFHGSSPEYTLMTAWNYESEILEKEQNYLERGGRFIIPLPDTRVIGKMGMAMHSGSVL